MKKRIKLAFPLFIAFVMIMPVIAASGAGPTSSSGVTGGGATNGNSSGTGLTTPARSGQLNTTPNNGTNGVSGATNKNATTTNNGTIIDNQTGVTGGGLGGGSSNPVGRVGGRVEAVSQDGRNLRVRDQNGNITDVTVSDGVVYGAKGANKSSSFTDIKPGDQLNYSVGTTGQVDSINWAKARP